MASSYTREVPWSYPGLAGQLAKGPVTRQGSLKEPHRSTGNAGLLNSVAAPVSTSFSLGCSGEGTTLLDSLMADICSQNLLALVRAGVGYPNPDKYHTRQTNVSHCLILSHIPTEVVHTFCCRSSSNETAIDPCSQMILNNLCGFSLNTC